ncbi:hypothetical protein G7062_04735 [Erysipelothrix sp. HDW6C]|uniref:CueP family metal-binding protein n=1 Tax=Erysipelothrix sp. HDW6C TaxID=2714930 RepID=UPI00140CFA6E|nr:CueP family metal-binding protein [Erysipelothrix sp. HDW6C]QIK69645.1 hypothetical protein G7062_04735 [Erysipelothrix sp. HDW6C]
MNKKLIIATFAVALIGLGGLFYISSRNDSSQAFLEHYKLADMNTVQLIDYLDGSDVKPEGLNAQITASKLILKDTQETVTLDISDELFYLSFAPYNDITHPCTDHVPTGCQGELVNRDFEVIVKDTLGTELFSGRVTTAKNGFAGIWLPRNTEGTITVTHYGQIATANISTFASDPTCLTTLHLS